MFDNKKTHAKACGEASTGYIYSKYALDNILEYVENPKFIICVRHPIDLSMSAHAQMLKSGNEDVEDFEVAWRLSSERREMRNLPKNRTDIYHHLYQDMGNIKKFMEPVLRKVSIKNVKIVTLDEIRSNPKKVYLDVLAYLGCRDDGREEFFPVNVRAYHRHKALADFVNRPPSVLLNTWTVVKKAFGIKRIGLIRLLREWNLEAKYIPISNDFYHEMERYYQGDIEYIERLIGMPLECSAKVVGQKCCSKKINLL